MDLQEVADAFTQARAVVQRSGQLFNLSRLKYFGSYFREPHYGSNYKDLYDLEIELNGGVNYAAAYELLSIWRLARDDDYPRWARSTGASKCQIALFGLHETNDWFCRRNGAHHDIIRATLRLLENGIQPRWMVFLTKKGLPELQGILRLIEELRLRERADDIGGHFDVFLNDPTPIGEAGNLEEIRITAGDRSSIPRELITATEEYTRKPFQPRTEDDIITEILSAADAPIRLDYPEELWFFITPDWSVYPNVGSLEPWWRLGNLKTDGMEHLLAAFVGSNAPGLRAGTDLTLHEAVSAYGRIGSDRLYSRSDLCQLWLEKYCRDRWKPEQARA